MTEDPHLLALLQICEELLLVFAFELANVSLHVILLLVCLCFASLEVHILFELVHQPFHHDSGEEQRENLGAYGSEYDLVELFHVFV